MKCPLHGHVIARDSKGNPVSKEDVTPPEDNDPDMLRDIEATTGVNFQTPSKKVKGKKTKSGAKVVIAPKISPEK